MSAKKCVGCGLPLRDHWRGRECHGPSGLNEPADPIYAERDQLRKERDAAKRAKEWAEIAIGMLTELRMDYVPLALTDKDGRSAVLKLQQQRDDLKQYLDAVAEALHPHKPKFTEDRWTYQPDQLPGMITKLAAEVAGLRELYRWRPIEEIHEDYGPCVLMNLDDPGLLDIGSNLDHVDLVASGWTHFTRFTPLTHEEAAALDAARKKSTDQPSSPGPRQSS